MSICVPFPCCDWRPDDIDSRWNTQCGESFELLDGSPRDNGMKFCCYCGERLIVAGLGESTQ